MKKALILVDIQNDFLSQGSMAVANSDEILPVVNQLLSMPFDLFVVTMDWHPLQHCSFASTWGKKRGETVSIEGEEQVLWPDHCVEGSQGAKLSDKIIDKKFDFIAYKGSDKDVDSYSAFFDNRRRKSTGLGTFLKQRQVKELYFAGLATDYCVYFSAMDALELGFSVYVILEGCRGIEVFPGDIARVCHELEKKGAKFITVKELESQNV